MLRSAASVLLLLSWLPAGASAEPLDLANPHSREILVRFEVSPPAHPGQTDSIYTTPYRARFELLPDARRARVTVASHVVETLLRDRDPVAGTFSDFVWVFDLETGAVVSAELTGALLEEARLGWIRKQAETRIHVKMDTERVAGFSRPRNLFGNRVFMLCEGEADDHCTRVRGRRLDPASGYVNAVGVVKARTAFVSFETFSPLGEAIFTEITGSPVASALPAVAAGGPVVRASAVGGVEIR